MLTPVLHEQLKKETKYYIQSKLDSILSVYRTVQSNVFPVRNKTSITIYHKMNIIL